MTQIVAQYLLGHPATDVLVLSVIGTAFSSTIPEARPKTLDDLWAWMRDFVTQLGNARRHTTPTSVNPTTPADPAGR